MRVGVVGLMMVMAISSRGQESVLQQTNPPSLKWYQITTPGFQILYPVGFESQAQRMANTLDRIHEPESRTMGVRPKPIKIILQNQSTLSNGFVMLAPRHSEFFAMPTQNYNFQGTNDWLNLLASHEYRHVVQFQRSISGFTRLVYYVFGQQATAGLAAAAAPQWFWEGDAVVTETAFTRSGRGRIPNFDLLFRTNLMEGKTFNYHKQYLRSYKDNIPNHYILGYHLVSYLRRQTNDPFIWEKIAHRAWEQSIIPFTFSSAIKKEYGKHVTDLYYEMAADLKKKWSDEAATLPFTSFERVNQRTNTAYTDYLYPQELSNGTVVVQKSGIGDIEQLVALDGHGQDKIFVQGIMNATGQQSAAGERVVWNEYRYDPRWLMRTYSVIKGYDLSSREAKDVSRRSRYAGASLSPDGSRVATVRTETDYQTQLVIVDYASGAVVKEFPNPDNDFYSMPHWTEDGKSVIALKLNKRGKSIVRIDAGSGNVTELYNAGDENIGYPVPTGHYILYNSPYSGIDNIYALDIDSGERFQVTCSRYGAYNPALSADGKVIYYNEQTVNGMDVVRIPWAPDRWRPIDQVEKGLALYQPLVEQEGRPGIFDSVGTKTYEARRYHRATGMINPHSWGPYFVNGNYTQAQFGIYSQDVLSTTSINAGYMFDINERTGAFQAGVSYQGFYPIIDVQTQIGDRQSTTGLFGRDVKFEWREVGTSAGLRIPLVLTRSKYLTQVEVSNAVGLTNVTFLKNTVSENGTIVSQGTERYVPARSTTDSLDYVFTSQVGNGHLLSNTFTLSYTHVLKQSRRDFNPKFGQALAYENYSTPYGGDYTGKMWVVRGIAFFPGVLKHHSLFFRGSYQYRPPDASLNNYAFRNRVFRPRGYSSSSFALDNTFYSFQANYQLPLWYPDIAVGPLLNIQRVKLNLFYDYGHTEGKNFFYNQDYTPPQVYYSKFSQNYQSAGAEFTFDINVMRLLPQIEVGFRVSHVTTNDFQNGGVAYEFLIGNIPF